jgi:16S rRNA processing protein RimM
VLVPFVSELVPVVDLDAGTLTVEPRPGLLDPDADEIAGTDGKAGTDRMEGTDGIAGTEQGPA